MLWSDNGLGQKAKLTGTPSVCAYTDVQGMMNCMFLGKSVCDYRKIKSTDFFRNDGASTQSSWKLAYYKIMTTQRCMKSTLERL